MQKIKNKIKAIIFDMDGTIINTENIWYKAVLETLKEEGIKNFAEFKDFFPALFGIGMHQGTVLIKEKFKLKSSLQYLISKQLDLSNKYVAAKKLTIPFIKGFEQFHKELQENGFKTAIATNANWVSINKIEKKVNLRSFFEKNIYCIDDVANKAKPDPAVFIHAAKSLKVKTEECIIFEDSPHGFKAAQRAGIKCIAIKNKFNGKYLNLANASIDGYDQAKQAMENLILNKKYMGKNPK